MNDNSPPRNDPLRELLHNAKPAPQLPPRFRESVWQRIDRAQGPAGGTWWTGWLNRAAAWLLQPRVAMAGVATMLLVGASIGVLQGGSLANELAKQQYFAAVNPLSTR